MNVEEMDYWLDWTATITIRWALPLTVTSWRRTPLIGHSLTAWRLWRNLRSCKKAYIKSEEVIEKNVRFKKVKSIQLKCDSSTAYIQRKISARQWLKMWAIEKLSHVAHHVDNWIMYVSCRRNAALARAPVCKCLLYACLQGSTPLPVSVSVCLTNK